jgi:hypothetical protein
MSGMNRLSLFGEVWLMVRQNKKWWLLPIVMMMLGLGAVIVFAGGSALAPFIYTIF